MRQRLALILSGVGLIAIFVFQNCGGKFQAARAGLNGATAGSSVGGILPVPVGGAMAAPLTRWKSLRIQKDFTASYLMQIPLQMIYHNKLILFNAAGAYFDPLTGNSTPISLVNAPTARIGNATVFTKDSILVWGGQGANGSIATGAILDLATNTWRPMSTINAPSVRQDFASAWTGQQFLVWGGRQINVTSQGAFDGEILNDGAVYNLATDTWQAMTATDAPAARMTPNVVWTGSQMVMLNGLNLEGGNNRVAGGAMYNLAQNTWTTLDSPLSPTVSDIVLWTGSKVADLQVYGTTTASGAALTPTTNTWTTLNLPDWFNRRGVMLVGSKLISYGGLDAQNQPVAGGYVIDPDANTSRAMSIVGAPSARSAAAMCVVGAQVLIWGGVDVNGTMLNDGALYDVPSDIWTALPASSLSPRAGAGAMSLGGQVILFGGYTTTDNQTFNNLGDAAILF